MSGNRVVVFWVFLPSLKLPLRYSTTKAWLSEWKYATRNGETQNRDYAQCRHDVINRWEPPPASSNTPVYELCRTFSQKAVIISLHPLTV